MQYTYVRVFLVGTYSNNYIARERRTETKAAVEAKAAEESKVAAKVAAKAAAEATAAAEAKGGMRVQSESERDE